MAANGTGSLLFTDDVTAYRSRMNSEVYRALLSAQIEPNTAQLIGHCFTVKMDNGPNILRNQHEFVKVKKFNNLQ